MARLLRRAVSEWFRGANGFGISTAENFTMAVWYKPDTVTNYLPLLSLDTNTANDGWFLEATLNQFSATRWGTLGPTTSQSLCTPTFVAGEWFHGAGVYTGSGSAPTAYYNGANAVTGTSNAGPSAGPSYCGVGGMYSIDSANGTISVPAIWNEALTASEIAYLATGADPRLVRPHALVMFIEDFDTAANPIATGSRGPTALFTQNGGYFGAPALDAPLVVANAARHVDYKRRRLYTNVVPGVTGTIAVTEAADSISVGGAASTRTASVTLVTSPTDNTARINLTGLRWYWFDQVPGATFVAPTNQGTTGTTDGAGLFTASLPGSVKTNGQIGYLVVTDSDGTTTQSPSAKAFAGPVAVVVA